MIVDFCEVKFYTRAGMFLNTLCLTTAEEVNRFILGFVEGHYDSTGAKFAIIKYTDKQGIIIAHDNFKGISDCEEFILRGLL